MKIKLSAEDVGWQLREAADEAAWGVQEKVLWRVSDAARAGLRRALRLLAPLHRLIQTKLAWPLADRLGEYSPAARTSFATVGVVAAIGAGIAGAALASGGETPHAAPLRAGAPAPVVVAESSGSLEGVAPDFVADPNQAAKKPGEHKVAAGREPIEVGPDTPPDQVAISFAQAFVLYEVGKSDEKTARSFDAASTRALSKALEGDPPRLPSGKKVPEARVLNVVPGEKTGQELTMSVSLLRLQSASELRLTLVKSPKKGWRVAQVLG